jgi:hypothetical protein
MLLAVLRERKCENDVIMRHVVIFVMLDTSQIVTPLNAVWSHNVAHNCDYDTFKVDRFYDILQHLLCICMLIKASVKFQGVIHPKVSKFRNILRFLNYKENIQYM